MHSTTPYPAADGPLPRRTTEDIEPYRAGDVDPNIDAIESRYFHLTSTGRLEVCEEALRHLTRVGQKINDADATLRKAQDAAHLAKCTADLEKAGVDAEAAYTARSEAILELFENVGVTIRIPFRVGPQ